MERFFLSPVVDRGGIREDSVPILVCAEPESSSLNRSSRLTVGRQHCWKERILLMSTPVRSASSSSVGARCSCSERRLLVFVILYSKACA